MVNSKNWFINDQFFVKTYFLCNNNNKKNIETKTESCSESCVVLSPRNRFRTEVRTSKVFEQRGSAQRHAEDRCLCSAAHLGIFFSANFSRFLSTSEFVEFLEFVAKNEGFQSCELTPLPKLRISTFEFRVEEICFDFSDFLHKITSNFENHWSFGVRREERSSSPKLRLGCALKQLQPPDLIHAASRSDDLIPVQNVSKWLDTFFRGTKNITINQKTINGQIDVKEYRSESTNNEK